MHADFALCPILDIRFRHREVPHAQLVHGPSERRRVQVGAEPGDEQLWHFVRVSVRELRVVHGARHRVELAVNEVPDDLRVDEQRHRRRVLDRERAHGAAGDVIPVDFLARRRAV